MSGSRIASYDGGNVSVTSVDGDVDAGFGALGAFRLTTTEVNPDTGAVFSKARKYFGSGIMALTRDDSSVKVGDIAVKAGRDILANSGGVLQLAFNQVDQTGVKVDLDAGRDIRATQSGVLGGNVSLKAGGSIEGLIVANQNIIIDAAKNFSGTALGGGAVSVNAGGNVAGARFASPRPRARRSRARSSPATRPSPA